MTIIASFNVLRESELHIKSLCISTKSFLLVVIKLLCYCEVIVYCISCL